MKHALKWLFHVLLVRPVVWGLLGLKVRNREGLPRSGPAIIVANHNSHLDGPVLMSLFRIGLLEKIRPVAAGDYFERCRSLAGFAHAMFGIIPIRRGRQPRHGGDPLGACSEALRRGDILIICPEGTRGVPERLGVFKTGIAHLAKRHPDVPVVPVFLCGLGKTLPKGARVPVPFLCDARVGDPFRWTGDRQSFMREMRARILELAGEARRSVQFLAQPSGQVLDELPGDAARSRSPGHRPFFGLGVKVGDRDVEAVVAGVSLDDLEERRLVADVEPQP